MSNLLNIGVRALLANQAALQTAGNNVSNVNTPGYSRQTVVLANVAGQFSGSGYYGQGVSVATIERNYSQFLTRQSVLASSIASADSSRLEKLTQLEDVFQGGTSGLGASVSDMLNAFSDVANAPTDLTARTVVLTRATEAAARFRTASDSLDALQTSTLADINQGVIAVNSFAAQIASINSEIAKAVGNGHEPNDLLDKREQLVADLNKIVQTSSVTADDGSVGIFLAGSQVLVLGNTVAKLKVSADAFNDSGKVQMAVERNGLTFQLGEDSLGGGKLAGLMRFNNNDLTSADDLLGRMAVSISTVVNAQHRLGIDLNGVAGSDLYNPPTLPDGLAGTTNTGNAAIGITVSDSTQLVASQYEVQFTGGGTGNVVRLSDGTVTTFAVTPIEVDGLVFTVKSGSEAVGDIFRMKPFSTAARDINMAFSSPKALAVASPVEAIPNSTNTGGLAIVSLQPKTADANLTQTVTLTFTAGGTFDLVGTGTGDPTGVAYTSGIPIAYNGWELTLKGAPQVGDVYTVQMATPGYTKRNANNADAMLALRDIGLFDGAALTDGYAGLMAQVGTSVQSVQLAAGVSASIATNVEKDRAGVSGVNLDEEAAKMLQYQQAYQGSAKLLQIADSIFKTLIQSLG